MEKKKNLDIIRTYAMILVLVLVVVLFTIITEGKILYPMNMSNLISQNAYVFILASGMLLCILTGGNIDLSVGSVVCFVGAVGALLMDKDVNVYVVILVMLLIGTAIGAFQAFWIAYVRIPPFIVTLAGMLAFRGLSNVILKGLTVPVTNETFINLFGGGANCYVKDIFGTKGFNVTCMLIGIIIAALFTFIEIRGLIVRAKKGYTGASAKSTIIKVVLIDALILFYAFRLAQYKGIPTVLIWVAIVVLVYDFITSNTTVGRHFYAVGGNEKATKLSGINTNKVYFLAYTNMGFLSALAGMLVIARMTSSNPTLGNSYEMDAIGSCFIGGASAYGGIGTVPGVIVGAVLMGVINLGMLIAGVDANMQKVVKGLVLLAAVIFDVVSKRGGKVIAKN